jgi:hypothetical protein
MAPDSDLDFYEYCGVTMQEMIVRIEDHILLNIMNFVTNLPLDKLTPAGKGSSTTQHQKFVDYPLSQPNSNMVYSGKRFSSYSSLIL